MRKRLAGFLTAPLVVLAVLAAGVTRADTCKYYEALTTTDSPNKKSGGETSVRAWVSGQNAKIEFVEAPKQALFGQGSYILTTDGGRTVKLVDPEKQTWSEIDVEAMLNLAGSMMSGMGGVMNLEFEDTYNEKLLDEPGEALLGHATTHQQWKSGHTMKVSVMGFKQQTKVDMLQDFWFTSDLDADAFRVWLRPDRFKTGNAELDAWVQEEAAKVQGVPLRTVNVTTTEDKKGERTTVRSETIVTTLRDEPDDPERYIVPANYENKPLIPEMGEMPAEDAEATGEEGDAAAKEAERGLEGVKKAIGGLFGKKKKKD